LLVFASLLLALALVLVFALRFGLRFRLLDSSLIAVALGFLDANELGPPSLEITVSKVIF